MCRLECWIGRRRIERGAVFWVGAPWRERRREGVLVGGWSGLGWEWLTFVEVVGN